MSKLNKVIAGLGVVAGLGVALAPVATFAADAGSDNLTVNVESSCAIDSENEPFAGVYAGTAAVADETVAITRDSGTNSVAYDCSENSKITIHASTDGLAYGSTDTIAANMLGVNLTGANGLEIESGFTGNNTYGALGTNVLVAQGTAPASTSGKMTFTVNGYKATLKGNQKPGTYEGTVAYTFELVNE